MNTFIRRVSQQLGVSQGTTRSTLCSLLHLIRQQANAQLADELISSLPGALSLLQDSQAPTIAGQDTTRPSPTDSDPAGPHRVLQVIACLTYGGLDIDRARPFLALFAEYAMEHAGASIVSSLFDDLPALKVMLHGGGSPRGAGAEHRSGRQPKQAEAQAAARLEAAGIGTLGQLVGACATPEGCKLVAQAIGINKAWLQQMLEPIDPNHAPGIAANVIAILAAAGIDVLPGVKQP